MWASSVNRRRFSLKRILPWLIALICACEKKDILSDDKPRIVEMEVAGIDKKSVVIDQEKNLIIVELPDGMSKSQLYTKVRLTKGAELVPRMHGTRIDLFGCSEEDKFFMVTRQNAGLVPDTVKYGFQFNRKASLQLELADGDNGNQYPIAGDGSFFIKMRNFFDGSSGELHLKHQLDLTVPTIVINSCHIGFRGYREADPSDGQFDVRIPLDAHVVPGPYTISLHKQNGRVAIASQALTLTKGPIRLSWSGYLVERSINGAPVRLTGFNLYESSNLAVELTDGDGKKYQTKIMGYEPFGRNLTFDPGRSIKPGYFTLQVFTNGKLASYYDGTRTFQNYRFAVTRTPQQPFIMMFEKSNDKYSEYSDVFSYRDKPLTFEKGIGSGELQWGFENDKTSRLWFDVEMESLTQSGYVKRTDIWPRDFSTYSEGDQWTLGGIFSPNYPPGKYRMRVVVTNPETHEEYKSEPFERVVEIR